NEKIIENIQLQEDRRIPIETAKKAGAMMLFGEKYGDTVRMITFDPDFSRELCGGIHVHQTSEIRLFRITGEASVAAGIRRIEARTGEGAVSYLNDQIEELQSIRDIFRSPVNLRNQIENLQTENEELKKALADFQQQQSQSLREKLSKQAQSVGEAHLVASEVRDLDGAQLKNLAYELGEKLAPAIVILGNQMEDKAQLMVYIDKSLTERYGLHAGQLIRQAATHIGGGG